MFSKSFRKTVITGAAASLMALGLIGTAGAVPITVGGVTWDPDDPIDFKAVSSLRETVVTGTTQILSGYGRVTDLNGSLPGSGLDPFCVGCELTFEFGGYEVTKFDGTVPGEIVFKDGWVNFYVDFTPDFDETLPATAGSHAGTILWLTLLGHTDIQPDADTGTLFGIINSGSVSSPDGDGGGLLDVGTASGVGNPESTAGIANPHFDTNTKPDSFGSPGFADFSFVSSFEFTTDLPGSHPLTGSITLRGDSIPEPATLAIFGFSLLGLGLVSRRRRRTA